MMKGIRTSSTSHIYEMFTQLALLGRKKRGALTFVPHGGLSTKRTLGVDSVAYPGFGKKLATGATHSMDGSKVVLYYRAAHKPTAAQIAKADYAVNTLKIDRRRYTGTLVDVFISKGTLYLLLAGVLERDREQKTKHQMNFRMMNLEDGEVYKAFIEEVAARKLKARLPAAGSIRQRTKV
jgi:hypothetical protein